MRRLARHPFAGAKIPPHRVARAAQLRGDGSDSIALRAITRISTASSWGQHRRHRKARHPRPGGSLLLRRSGSVLLRRRQTAAKAQLAMAFKASTLPATAWHARIRSPTILSSTRKSPSYSRRFRMAWHLESTCHASGPRPSVFGRSWNTDVAVRRDQMASHGLTALFFSMTRRRYCRYLLLPSRKLTNRVERSGTTKKPQSIDAQGLFGGLGTLQNVLKGRSGGQGRNRTTDTRIFSPLLYRLSYLAVNRRLYRPLLRCLHPAMDRLTAPFACCATGRPRVA
jgi:hypothetical protein